MRTTKDDNTRHVSSSTRCHWWRGSLRHESTILIDVFPMAPADLQDEFQEQFDDVVSRLQSMQFFQSDWDIAAFAVFFIFIG
ncbi:hypothetical protein NHX12_031547 [Muraenolepis orangiensis]|uniref:Uncharacterized protein n=1 Tax=Muraenolepis orangiensis TaxID=630683 RepID=A0A9Q0IKN9_9TELE|nr:hypothetical protein NHX12_031547 [Muraenolepis orangiensis]